MVVSSQSIKVKPAKMLAATTANPYISPAFTTIRAAAELSEDSDEPEPAVAEAVLPVPKPV